MTSKTRTPSQIAPDNLNATIADRIELVCGIKDPTFPFEDYQACMQLNCWLRFPHSEAIYKQATALSLALLLQALDRGHIKGPRGAYTKLKAELHKMPLGELLLTPPLQNSTPAYQSFAAAFTHVDEDITDVRDIVEFFLHYPIDDPDPRIKAPSINKAMYFIDAGGFVDRMAPPEEQKLAKVSISKLKQSWVRYATVAPLHFAADETEGTNYQDFLRMPPDDIQSIRTIRHFLTNRKHAKGFFGMAKHIQGVMLSYLDERSRNRFSFIDFPDSIKAIEVECDPFDERKKQVLLSYQSQNFKKDSEAR